MSRRLRVVLVKLHKFWLLLDNSAAIWSTKYLYKGEKEMSNNKRNRILDEFILLDIDDVCELTKWGKETVRKLFAYDKEFPAVRIGKKYLVELEAFRNYFSERRV